MPEPNCTCKTCGGRFYCKPSLIRLRNGGQHCSRRCKYTDPDVMAQGEAHPEWKGDAAATTTKRTRAQRRYELGDCERCGAEATDRHHIDGNTGNNVRANLEFLCRRCHMTVDGRLAALAARNRLSDDTRDDVITLAEQGLGQRAIARATGVSRTTIRRWTAAAGARTQWSDA